EVSPPRWLRTTVRKWRASSTFSCRGARGRRLQNVFLHAPRFDFTEDEFIRVAAVDLVHHLKTWRDFARLAELAEDGTVQFRFVDLARVLPGSRRIAVGVRVGEERVLMRSSRDAQRPSRPEIGNLLDRFQIVVEFLIAVVG